MKISPLGYYNMKQPPKAPLNSTSEPGESLLKQQYPHKLLNHRRFPRHISRGKVQVTLAVIVNHQFHLLPPISASFPPLGRGCRDSAWRPGLAGVPHQLLGVQSTSWSWKPPAQMLLLNQCWSCSGDFFVYLIAGTQRYVMEPSRTSGTT